MQRERPGGSCVQSGSNSRPIVIRYRGIPLKIVAVVFKIVFIATKTGAGFGRLGVGSDLYFTARTPAAHAKPRPITILFNTENKQG